MDDGMSYDGMGDDDEKKRWRAEDDLRMAVEVERIKADKDRWARVKEMAAEKMKAMEKING